MIMRSTVFLAALLVLLTLICCTTEEIRANPVSQIKDTVEINSGKSGTLQEAISSIKDSGIILINGKITIDESISIPNNIGLVVNEGGMFELQGDASVKIGGTLKAGLYPIFNSIVEFSEGSVTAVKSEWFGMGDLAVNFALLSAGKIPVELTNDIRVNKAILMNSGQTLLFENATIFPSKPMLGGAVIKNRHTADSNITVIGGLIDGTNVTDLAYDAILFTGVDNALIQNVVAREVHITAS